ncbi:hypothetical protein DI270_032865 [Microbispora triticiradicis]|uniref:Uncharacterized protein n=3 Tax=Microbispora TaxID=2005 RepID=A0ABY3LWN8_9ACTN|nr:MULTISPECIES: hypothetical protein [Microbispora]RGA00811.1 hypothetical protein DI270_032865 [Microbispora triticiradicis]TLP54546.1 hypothetical protein FED44_27725 [Microbispora fusca]TYB56490.1 hypothetical protein FXF59_20350 [Microbispora tritici]GLW20741.1 hypothetical protein Mame01_07840 [Microbispora amethystogenes]
MNAPLRRALTICAAAVLVTGVTAAPVAALDIADYTCAWAAVLPAITPDAYNVLGRDCTGSGTGTAGSITTPSGPYFCRFVYYIPENGYIAGRDCN